MANDIDRKRMEAIMLRIKARGAELYPQDGWEFRGATYTVVPTYTLVHHDASSIKSGIWGALGIITFGRTGIPGPLAQFQVARGDVPRIAVTSAGVANHAGEGGPWGAIRQNDMNPNSYGMEVANDGLGEPYSQATLTAMVICQDSILEVIT